MMRGDKSREGYFLATSDTAANPSVGPSDMCNLGGIRSPSFLAHESGVCTQMHDYDDGKQQQPQEIPELQQEQAPQQPLKDATPYDGAAL